MKTIEVRIGSRTEQFKVIEPTAEAAEVYGFAYGCELLVVPKEAVQALLSGKACAFDINYGEYKHFVIMKEE